MSCSPATASAPSSAPRHPRAQPLQPPPWGHHAPDVLPSPKRAPQPPGVKATYLSALLPGDSPHGGLANSIHLGGRLRVGQRSSCSSACAGASPTARTLRGNRSTYLAVAISTSGNALSFESSAGTRAMPQPCSPPPVLPAQPFTDGHAVAPTGWGQKKRATSSPRCYL